MVQRNSPNDCLRPPLSDDLPVRCQQLSKALADCKYVSPSSSALPTQHHFIEANVFGVYRRGLVDMRKRFRGNAPISVSREIEGGGGQTSTQAPQQLYAGKPAFTSVKEISGNEVQMDPEKTRGF
ncbi:hypothetical protein ZTR_02564 [Talaromyces verruculosus]|nr:hypothetical protein ZTR_02564 [Talaromyces verruculosus]